MPQWLRTPAPNLLITQSTPHEDQTRTYAVVMSFPTATGKKSGDSFGLPSEPPLGIEWTIVWDENEKRGPHSTTHFHNMTDVWIPPDMLHMYLQLLKRLQTRWEAVCQLGENHLHEFVGGYFKLAAKSLIVPNISISL